jgi:hypothetical protein
MRLFLVAMLWLSPAISAAQVERFRVRAGEMIPIACAEQEEVPPSAAYPCQIVAEQPSGDAVIYVEEPSRALALLLGALAIVVLRALT